MTKRFVSGDDLTRDSFRLARQILDSGWRPDVLIGLWRGGSPIAIAVHEFLNYAGCSLRHAVVTCRSYTGLDQRAEVVFENLDAALANIARNSRVLVVDDIFDTGHTARGCLDRLHAVSTDVRIATLFWKPTHNQTDLRPDYYIHCTDDWVVFPHELDGLTLDEVRQKDPVLHELLTRD